MALVEWAWSVVHLVKFSTIAAAAEDSQDQCAARGKNDMIGQKVSVECHEYFR